MNQHHQVRILNCPCTFCKPSSLPTNRRDYVLRLLEEALAITASCDEDEDEDNQGFEGKQWPILGGTTIVEPDDILDESSSSFWNDNVSNGTRRRVLYSFSTGNGVSGRDHGNYNAINVHTTNSIVPHHPDEVSTTTPMTRNISNDSELARGAVARMPPRGGKK